MNYNTRLRTRLSYIFRMTHRGYARLRNYDGKFQWYLTMKNNRFVNDDVKSRFADLEFEVAE